ncbi:hypothetical protein KJ925_02910 [Patescibacteria group bacterium]|nr:hypothetical protein [Patescibacteria group bacterium]
MYLKRLDRLTAYLAREANNRVGLSVIGQNPETQDMVFGIIDHLDGFCRKCHDDERRFDTSLCIPDGEAVFLTRATERLRTLFPKKSTSETLQSQTPFCKTVRSVILKYHPDLLAHEIMSNEPDEVQAAIDLALDRIYPALRSFA